MLTAIKQIKYLGLELLPRRLVPPGSPRLGLVASLVAPGLIWGGAVGGGCWLCWMTPLLGARQEGWGHPRVLSPLRTALAGWQEVARVNPTLRWLRCLGRVNGNC